MSALQIHFFTIVLDGMPFISWHLEQFKKLRFPWVWHVVEGVALLKHDTAWSLATGGKVPEILPSKYPSRDGTSAYLDLIAGPYNPVGKVQVYRKCCGQRWDGKIEMVREATRRIKEPCLLWQIDADELWTTEQIEECRHMFIANPDATAARFRCHYFVGPNLVITTRETYGNHDGEWLRVWRYQPGDFWMKHEPPLLLRDGQDVGFIKPLGYDETEKRGLVFQHFAYATEPQLRWKESYYGYPKAVAHWRLLQNFTSFPTLLRDFFPWVKDAAKVDRAENVGVTPLITC